MGLAALASLATFLAIPWAGWIVAPWKDRIVRTRPPPGDTHTAGQLMHPVHRRGVDSR